MGAAVLGVPVKPTIKEVDSNGMVLKTLVRANLWEVQTPQVSLTLHILLASRGMCFALNLRKLKLR